MELVALFFWGGGGVSIGPDRKWRYVYLHFSIKGGLVRLVVMSMPPQGFICDLGLFMKN